MLKLLAKEIADALSTNRPSHDPLAMLKEYSAPYTWYTKSDRPELTRDLTVNPLGSSPGIEGVGLIKGPVSGSIVNAVLEDDGEEFGREV